MTTTTVEQSAPVQAQARGWFRAATDWLDARGKGAWIAAMVLGFILFWPVGLAVLFYMISTSRFSGGCARATSGRTLRQHRMQASGNSAFDAYREETLTRLEEEQAAFESFLQRLRNARDKAEFDAFMDERATRLKEPEPDSQDRD